MPWKRNLCSWWEQLRFLGPHPFGSALQTKIQLAAGKPALYSIQRNLLRHIGRKLKAEMASGSTGNPEP